MKKLVAVIILIACLFSVASAEKIYLRFGRVIDLEWDSDCVTVDDYRGNLWEFFGCDEYYYADLVLLIISENGTPNWIYDDVILEACPCLEEDAYVILEKYEKLFK